MGKRRERENVSVLDTLQCLFPLISLSLYSLFPISLILTRQKVVVVSGGVFSTCSWTTTTSSRKKGLLGINEWKEVIEVRTVIEPSDDDEGRERGNYDADFFLLSTNTHTLKEYIWTVFLSLLHILNIQYIYIHPHSNLLAHSSFSVRCLIQSTCSFEGGKNEMCHLHSIFSILFLWFPWWRK